VYHRLSAGRRRNDLQPTGAGDQNVAQAALPGQHMFKIFLGRDAQQNIQIGQPKVGVKKHHATPHFRKADAKVQGHVALPDSTLAASDGYYLYCVQSHAFTLNVETRAYPMHARKFDKLLTPNG
jgi:hypothetical protein